MSADEDPCVLLLRRLVPEFESVYQRYVEDEGGRLEPTEALARFADFISVALERHDEAVVSRGFLGIEALAAMDSAWFQWAGELTAEFLEAMWSDERAVDAMGPRTRHRLDLPRER